MDEKVTRISGTLDNDEENKKALYNVILNEFKHLYCDSEENNIALSFVKDNETGEVLIFITNSEKYVAVDIENNIQI